MSRWRRLGWAACSARPDLFPTRSRSFGFGILAGVAQVRVTMYRAEDEGTIPRAAKANARLCRTQKGSYAE
jgi:hypothetical protein